MADSDLLVSAFEEAPDHLSCGRWPAGSSARSTLAPPTPAAALTRGMRPPPPSPPPRRSARAGRRPPRPPAPPPPPRGAPGGATYLWDAATRQLAATLHDLGSSGVFRLDSPWMAAPSPSPTQTPLPP